MRGYWGLQLVVLRLVTRSGPAGTGEGMGVCSGSASAPLASDELGVAPTVADEVEADEREPLPAAGPEPRISVQSIGVEFGD